jgi:uncharacterized membrane protein
MERLANLILGLVSAGDFAALTIFFGCLLGITRLIEHSSDTRPSTSRITANYRRRWMQEVPGRSNRMVDAALLVTLRNGTTFFASGAIIAIGGIAALLGQTERLLDVATDFAGEFSSDIVSSQAVWEAKLLFIAVLMANAFLKFVWSHRLFGYCAIMMGATPENGTEAEMAAMVERSAQLHISAGRSFNRGLRMTYFSLAALAWFLGPVALVVATIMTSLMLYRREFRSDSRRALLDPGMR